MEAIKTYLLSACGAAFLCAVLNGFWSKKSYGAIGKLMSGLFLALTILQPLGKMEVSFRDDWFLRWELESQKAVQTGKEESISALHQIIKDNTAAYILQRAQNYSAQISVDVVLAQEDMPIPEKVYICGNIAPYAKQLLQEMIENDLGIPKENQIWTSVS